jgi:hypothetical protein
MEPALVQVYLGLPFFEILDYTLNLASPNKNIEQGKNEKKEFNSIALIFCQCFFSLFFSSPFCDFANFDKFFHIFSKNLLLCY